MHELHKVLSLCQWIIAWLVLPVKTVLISIGLASITGGYATAVYALSRSSLASKLLNPVKKGTLHLALSEHSGKGRTFHDNRQSRIQAVSHVYLKDVWSAFTISTAFSTLECSSLSLGFSKSSHFISDFVIGRDLLMLSSVMRCWTNVLPFCHWNLTLARSSLFHQLSLCWYPYYHLLLLSIHHHLLLRLIDLADIHHLHFFLLLVRLHL